MPYTIDETHDPKRESWVESANDPETDFPIQNLPLCCFVAPQGFGGEEAGPIHVGVPIGDHYFSLTAAHVRGLTADWERGQHIDGFDWFNCVSLDGLCDATRSQMQALRTLLVSFLGRDSQQQEDLKQCLIERDEVELCSPFSSVPNYTDFYASVYHATNVGSMFRPDNPLLPNYKWIPVGYHGRASSIVPSGTPIVRPNGQQTPAEVARHAEPGDTHGSANRATEPAPTFGPCKMLDYEMEMGAIIGRGNELGRPVTMAEAEDHILGLCILNDWSARDIQKWEYVPLGPFLAKNFASTVSPYLVTMEALAPFRCPAMERPAGDPQPLPHLDSERNRAAGGFDITLEVSLASKQMRDTGLAPLRLSRGNFRDMYWTVAQMIAHHTSGGCNLQPGDLLGSGTISGKSRDSRGSLLELTWDGDPFASPPVLVPGTQRTPIELPTGETRKFLADGDEVIMRAYCERDGFRRIGFGECRGVIQPAVG